MEFLANKEVQWVPEINKHLFVLNAKWICKEKLTGEWEILILTLTL